MMKTKKILTALTLVLGVAWVGPLGAQTNLTAETSSSTDMSLGAETSPWTFDASLYGLAAGMSGNVIVKGIPSDVNVGFDEVWNHLKFGAMGTARVGYDHWALSSDVVYMDLGATKGAFTAGVEQWMVQPALEYNFCQYFDAYAGARYNSIQLTMTGPLGVNPSGTEAWWDPVIGSRIRLPVAGKLSFNVSGDIGGFGVGSELTWQAFPFFSFQFTKMASMQLGYRFLYTDYSTGSGFNQFKYDILTCGPQIGFAVHF
ncbi:MAG TPA: hypothetical protein VN048_08045 [Verrucomicrobiae bacterium]|jgi:hypothetical protein|nr:hypothetical protein [Verrucomicrobiae bacterium]